MISQWFKGTWQRITERSKLMDSADHSMGGYHELCEKTLKFEQAEGKK